MPPSFTGGRLPCIQTREGDIQSLIFELELGVETFYDDKEATILA